MRAQVNLTPTESKNLIAKAISRMEIVKQALSRGKVVLHPSSTTYFIVEEITGSKPKTNVWVCGVIIPKAACIEMGVVVEPLLMHSESVEKISTSSPDRFPNSWVIEDGEFRTGIPLGEILDELGPEDVYIKGANALDVQGNVGVLIGNLAGAGTIGLVMAASKKKGFSAIFPIGLEKLIPVSIKEAAKEAVRKSYEYGMGIPCSLFPVQGITITELKAVEILSGAKAVPIAAGGLGGAEGSITLVIKGEREQVTQAIEYVEQSKGAKLPPLRTFNCNQCNVKICRFPVVDKHWA